ncbi:hypothetical protein HYALB_00002848 [Hymenoscyphus albidus]|uniref:Endopolyphosphatase n=1 Tax=Hymenoscyphus albidus TaxID=595503 RepID=A0A9N9LJ71_9HELO|nr:hypothetical protein HYALB_00002848 [Hymenoscyphus albidus]
MRARAIYLALAFLQISHAKPVAVGSNKEPLQTPLEDLTVPHHRLHASRRLHGKFLHITDLHPDPHYKSHSSTGEDDACHRGKGHAGTFGAETTDCDSPYALINSTFKWIAENIKDELDFVVWTGDSARHDSDEKISRTAKEVLDTNTWVAQKFSETFSAHDDPQNALSIPIVSTFGNNDILPHNILLSGPNKWLKAYTGIWDKFIPEEQRHGFQRGGWYYVEVIPKKLAVFSLNTLYFFKNNAGVDGCALRSEPGFEHFEWLRIQLQFIRERGMKAILIGHVPPARTESKELWDETCWQKYILWLQQYRDVIVGGLYGHMNIDHFMLHDTKEIKLLAEETLSSDGLDRVIMEDELNIQSANDYLEELRQDWSDLPNPASLLKDPNHGDSQKKKGKKSEKDKLLDKIGGQWGERFHVTNVGPSIVPNYFPTLRIIEYNITGLEETPSWADVKYFADPESVSDFIDDSHNSLDHEDDFVSMKETALESENLSDDSRITKRKKKHGKKPKKPDFTVPLPPSKSSPPGPAHSPQSLTMLGYTQYFANLTHINNLQLSSLDNDDDVDQERWREGKHKGERLDGKSPSPKTFKYEPEYDTFNDSIYKMKDMTVRSYLRLAHRIGRYKPEKGDSIDDLGGFEDVVDEDCRLDEEADSEDEEDEQDQDFDTEKEKKKHKKHRKKKHHRRHEKNKVWLAFVQRAFVGTLEQEELRGFETGSSLEDATHNSVFVKHDGEL